MRSFHSGHFRFLNWNNDCSEGWRERGEDATKWPQRPCIFLECCLSYLEQPSIIVSCPFWHFLCPQSTPALHHTLCVFVFACVFPCTQIHVCIYTHKYTYVNTQERPAPRHSPGVTFRNYHFSRVLFFFSSHLYELLLKSELWELLQWPLTLQFIPCESDKWKQVERSSHHLGNAFYKSDHFRWQLTTLLQLLPAWPQSSQTLFAQRFSRDLGERSW